MLDSIYTELKAQRLTVVPLLDHIPESCASANNTQALPGLRNKGEAPTFKVASFTPDKKRRKKNNVHECKRFPFYTRYSRRTPTPPVV